MNYLETLPDFNPQMKIEGVKDSRPSGGSGAMEPITSSSKVHVKEEVEEDLGLAMFEEPVAATATAAPEKAKEKPKSGMFDKVRTIPISYAQNKLSM